MASEGGRSGELLPHGESLRRAVRWLDERSRDSPQAERARLVSEAAARFDLTPLEEDFLLRSWGRP